MSADEEHATVYHDITDITEKGRNLSLRYFFLWKQGPKGAIILVC